MGYGLARLVLTLSVLFAVSVPTPPVRAATPTVVARHWVIMDATDGRIVAERRAQEPVAIASLTKVMTALVALERGVLDQPVTIVAEDLVGESSAGLVAGQTVTLRTLLYGLLLRSGNDAAMAIARAVGGSPQAEDPVARRRFVDWMNAKAAALGLTATHFVNPHGLDEPGHVSSAVDLAHLTRAALLDPRFVAIFGAAQYGDGTFSWRHTNRLPDRYPGVIGGKTGWTDEAGLCLIEVAERAGQTLIVVLTGSTFDAWYDDAATLLDYGWTLVDPLDGPEDASRLFDWWWRRTDDPIARGVVARTWLWGPPLGAVEEEPYLEAPGGRRLVRYYEKGRMELTNPADPVDARWRVTGGRLAWELLTGWQQLGNHTFRYRGAAQIAVAGDPGGGITYAVLGSTLESPPGVPEGFVTGRLRPDGTVESVPELERYAVRYGAPFAETGHGVASVFATWLNQRGLVRVGGGLREEPLFSPWVAVMGFPITEPYWVRVPVQGVERDVLVQCFERRCLTYTPTNPPGWRVEMGNIGAHYRLWSKTSETATVATVGTARRS
ncbi:MAG: D-alanyl-D-alanine carboxypeptidase family protein [Thermomicrobium sp.]|nr:D-alanyl-D-alanine carboxypeptidase family protein [Thermomicrobium sp.]